MIKGQTWDKDEASDHERRSTRYAYRRKTLDGFPIPPRKFTYDEIKEYYDCNSIVCLRCGQSYQTLGKHLMYIHDITLKEYKDMYGLPSKKGLAGRRLKKVMKEATIIRMDKGEMPHITNNEEYRKLAVVASQKQTMQPFRSELSRKHLAKIDRTK
jgi:hypothetical protein